MSQKYSKNNLTKEDLKVAKSKIKEFTRRNGDVLSGYGFSSILRVLANITDKLSRDNNGKFKPGWFYSYLVSSLFSGASLQLMETYMQERQAIIQNNISEKFHQIFDSFPIEERLIRIGDIDRALEDVNEMRRSAAGYLYAKGGLISGYISSVALVGMTMISGGLSNLPIMGGVIAASGISSYIISHQMNEKFIQRCNDIRKAKANFRFTDRLLYTTSYKTETSDPKGRSKEIYKEKKLETERSYHRLTKLLNKYAIIGTIAKMAVIAGVVALTIGDPVNALVTTAATLGIYKAVNDCIDSHFSLKRFVGMFANAYKGFIPKIKVKYGKERIPDKANVIELDNVVVHRKDPKNPAKVSEDILFSIPGKQYIGPGITLLSGVSGAGKSTLINLLMHSRDVDGGTIKIGVMDDKNKFMGVEYSQLNFAEPSRHIAISMQKPEFMEMTVDEFIRLSNPNAPEELIQEVMEIVGIKDDPKNPEFISPKKIIKGSGQGISGGQANRLNLAQALIKDSPILILDEPTAGIDATMEEDIAQYLNKIKDKKTIIYITHNAEDIRDLNIDQALDLGKEDKASSAVMTCYDLSDPEIKEQFMEFFLDRDTVPSPPAFNPAREETLLEENDDTIQIPESNPQKFERYKLGKTLLLQNLIRRKKLRDKNRKTKFRLDILLRGRDKE